MRISALGSLSLLMVLAGCGDKDAVTPTTGAATGAATGGGNNKDSTGGPDPECLDITTMFIDMDFGWDAAAGTIIPVNINGTTLDPVFRLEWGPPGWTNDTSLPGPPDNWCFLEWDLTGMTNSNTDPAYWFQVVVSDPSRASSNCGQESSPGAGDMVTLCDADFFYGDPAAAFSGGNWTTKIGGDPEGYALDAIPYLEPYGYVEENFFGATMSFEFYGNPVEVLSWGSQIDNSGNVLLDGNNAFIHWTRYEVQGPGGLVSGFYQLYYPTYFTWGG